MCIRDRTDDLAVQEFLHPGQALCAPEGFADMEAAAARLQQALDSGERICVYEMCIRDSLRTAPIAIYL